MARGGEVTNVRDVYRALELKGGDGVDVGAIFNDDDYGLFSTYVA